MNRDHEMTSKGRKLFLSFGAALGNNFSRQASDLRPLIDREYLFEVLVVFVLREDGKQTF